MALRHVPVLDMRDLFAGGRREAAFIKGFGEALEGIGFATIEHHQIPIKAIHTLYEDAEVLFAQPEGELLLYETEPNGRQTGYTPYGVEGAKDRDDGDAKRFWHIRRELAEDHPRRKDKAFVPNLWHPRPPRFKASALRVFSLLDRMAKPLLAALDTYLDLPKGTLPEMVEDGESLLRVLHYPGYDAPLPEGTLRSAPHQDINLITLLVAAMIEEEKKQEDPDALKQDGLQVLPVGGDPEIDEDWVKVGETKNSIVVNVGDMLQMRTDGRMPSTIHRVTNPSAPARARYSAPFFVHPRGEVVLDQATGFTAGQYLRQRLIEIGLLKEDAA